MDRWAGGMPWPYSPVGRVVGIWRKNKTSKPQGRVLGCCLRAAVRGKSLRGLAKGRLLVVHCEAALCWLFSDTMARHNGCVLLPQGCKRTRTGRSCSMAPSRKHTTGTDQSDHCSGRANRKMRKPLVEKKRRARINESLHELRILMANTELQSKIENAEVLELTVKRVESILQSQAQVNAVNWEACERFTAGYIQCMHDVHTFVSTSPVIDPTVAAELLNHLLESMPLHGQDRIRVTLADTPLVSPAPSCTSSDDLNSDLDDTDSEQSQVSSSEEAELHNAALNDSKTVWRPW